MHPKLSKCTLCTQNYYTYHALHPDVTFAIIFDKILLHVLGTCFLLRWNKHKRLKHPSSKSIKMKSHIFPNLLSHVCASPQICILLKTSGPIHPTHPSSKEKEKTQIFYLWPERSMKENKDIKRTIIEAKITKRGTLN